MIQNIRSFFSFKKKPSFFIVAVLFYVFAVRFTSCEARRKIYFESSTPAYFRIGDDGMVYAAKSFQLSSEPTVFFLYAIDKETKEQWQMIIKLGLDPKDTIKVKYLNRELIILYIK